MAWFNDELDKLKPDGVHQATRAVKPQHQLSRTKNEYGCFHHCAEIKAIFTALSKLCLMKCVLFLLTLGLLLMDWLSNTLKTLNGRFKTPALGATDWRNDSR